MKFSKAFLQDFGGRTILDNIIGHGRWRVVHERIFEHKGRFYRTWYDVGATEYQDECPYEYAADWIECPEVKPVEKLVTVYEEIKEGDGNL